MYKNRMILIANGLIQNVTLFTCEDRLSIGLLYREHMALTRRILHSCGALAFSKFLEKYSSMMELAH